MLCTQRTSKVVVECFDLFLFSLLYFLSVSSFNFNYLDVNVNANACFGTFCLLICLVYRSLFFLSPAYVNSLFIKKKKKRFCYHLCCVRIAMKNLEY